MKHIFVYTLALMLCLSVAFAQDQEFEIPTYPVNESVDFRAKCFLDGDTCNASSTCQLTIYYPNDTALITDADMTFINDGLYNYTIANNTLNVSGIYDAHVRCSNDAQDNIVPNIVDGTFQVVPKLLYEGAGFVTWQIAISFGLIGVALAMALIATFSKTFWLKSLFLFGSLITMVSSGGFFLQIADIEGQTAVSASLQGFYFLVVFFAIATLAIWIVSILWDYMDQMGKLPRWAEKLGGKRKRLEE